MDLPSLKLLFFLRGLLHKFFQKKAAPEEEFLGATTRPPGAPLSMFSIFINEMLHHYNQLGNRDHLAYNIPLSVSYAHEILNS